MTDARNSQRLATCRPELERVLTSGSVEIETPPRFSAAQIDRTTVMVTMRDGVRLATDLYLPPKVPAPAIAMRTPYDRTKLAPMLMAIARQGYVVISQDCRGTGGSEPNHWNFFIDEYEDSVDFVEWVTQQAWFDGFLGACGGSYVGLTQWMMAMHPRMSTLAPEMSSLMTTAIDEPRVHMFQNAYARSMGKGAEKTGVSYIELEAMMVEETLATGYFNEPLYLPFREALLSRYPELRDLAPEKAGHWLWSRFRTLPPAQRAEFIKVALDAPRVNGLSLEMLPSVLGHQIPTGLCIRPCADEAELVRTVQSPPLIVTGWYDWGLRDSLETWIMLKQQGRAAVQSGARLLITPSAHNKPGYHEGSEHHPELTRSHRTENNLNLLLRWYEAVREEKTSAWPTVIYYLMGANEWRVASDWPVPEAKPVTLYLGSGGALETQKPTGSSDPDRYTYDPKEPTPTVGGSIVSYVYTPGSVDVSKVQERADVVSYTTPELKEDLDVVGPLNLVLYVSSSALDTDFVARLSDVFPDGRAIQLANRVLRARYRNRKGPAELLVPGRIYELEIDLWSTANRFKAGHRLRLDISSSDFPKYERHTNRAGESEEPIAAVQTIYHDPQHPSHLIVPVLGKP